MQYGHQSGNNESRVCIIEMLYTQAGGLVSLFNTQQIILENYIHIFLLCKNNLSNFVYPFSSFWHILLIYAFLRCLRVRECRLKHFVIETEWEFLVCRKF